MKIIRTLYESGSMIAVYSIVIIPYALLQSPDDNPGHVS